VWDAVRVVVLMQRLPNLSGLHLRLRAKTGAGQGGDGDGDGDGGDGDDARRVRQRQSLLDDEQRDRIGRFLDHAVKNHLGLEDTDPPPPAAERDRLIADARTEVVKQHPNLTDNWPGQLGDDEGLDMFPGGRPPSAEALATKLVSLWTQGFRALDAERRHARRERDEQIKRSIKQAERKEADAADDGGYFDDLRLDSADVPVADPELKAELGKRVDPDEVRRWAKEGYPDRCCTGAWGRL